MHDLTLTVGMARREMRPFCIGKSEVYERQIRIQTLLRDNTRPWGCKQDACLLLDLGHLLLTEREGSEVG
jgi:hypothetical protein